MTTLAIDQFDVSGRGQGRVLREVRGWIDRGEIRAGEPLPPMRDVAETLSVDKGTVCRAMALLQDGGLIRRQGRRLHVVGDDGLGATERGVLSETMLVVSSVADSDRPSARRRASGWLSRVIEGLLTAAHERHRHAMLVHPRSTTGTEWERLVSGRPMGCVVIATGQGQDADRAMLERMRAVGVPAVLFGEEIACDEHDMVTGDHVRGAYLLTRWLAERGRRRILRYWPYNIRREARPAWLAHRDEGFERAARELGLQSISSLEYPRPELTGLAPEAYFRARVRHAVGYLVDCLTGPDRVDAVLTPTDGMAYEVAAACRLLGVEPNRDVLIAGYDNDWAQCVDRAWESVGPAVTIEQDDAALGRTLVEVLMNRVASAGDVTLKTVEPRLIEIEVSDP